MKRPFLPSQAPNVSQKICGCWRKTRSPTEWNRKHTIRHSLQRKDSAVFWRWNVPTGSCVWTLGKSWRCWCTGCELFKMQSLTGGSEWVTGVGLEAWPHFLSALSCLCVWCNHLLHTPAFMDSPNMMDYILTLQARQTIPSLKPPPPHSHTKRPKQITRRN